MRTIIITTPDNIEIEYRLAGLGSRVAAVMIDFIIIFVGLAMLTLLLVATLLHNDYEGLFSGYYSGWVLGSVLIAYFVIIFGYFIAGELMMKGQSIGKKILGLRVIRENGLSVGIVQSLLRNLFRYFVDLIGIGIFTIFFTKKCKRIGDIVASTIVVVETPAQISCENLM